MVGIGVGKLGGGFVGGSVGHRRALAGDGACALHRALGGGQAGDLELDLVVGKAINLDLNQGYGGVLDVRLGLVVDRLVQDVCDPAVVLWVGDAQQLHDLRPPG